MPGAWMVATHKGVDRLQPMNESVFEQEIERAIDGRRRSACTLPLQDLQQVIGLDRATRGSNQLEDALA